MDPNRKLWNAGQQTLRRALAAGQYREAIGNFMIQHAMLHGKKVSNLAVWSFEVELWEGLTEAAFRIIPTGEEHSIAWMLFHIARIEDIVANLLLAGTPQLYLKSGWARQLNSPISHSANKMDAAAIAQLSAALNIQALRAYRLAVGRRTRTIVQKLSPEAFNHKVDPTRLQKVLDQGAVTPEALEIIRYWGSRTIAELMLMPLTRHNLLHLNEALRLKKKLK